MSYGEAEYVISFRLTVDLPENSCSQKPFRRLGRKEILDLWKSFYVIIFILISVCAEIHATLKFKSENLVIFAI